MPRKKEKKDRTSIIISTVVHLILLGAIGYWAHKQGYLEAVMRKVLQAVRSEKPQDQPKSAAPPRPPPSKLPPINQGLPPASAGGARRAVASDAPAAVGDSFFADTREQRGGPSAGGTGGSEKKELSKAPPPPAPKPPPPPRLFAQAPAISTIKQLFVERAKAAAATEAFGSEQISKSGVSDAADIVTKVSGASVSEGKFPVVRGLSDRYVLSTLNGAEVPSADPYRRSASLDLFPAQIIDKVVVTKTFTPDQPGSATAGGINIVTKSFPERPFLTLSLGGAYNSQSSLNEDFLSYQGGALDAFAMDDGTRALTGPAAAPGLTLPISAVRNSGRPTSAFFARNVMNATLQDEVTRALGGTEFGPTRESAPLNQNFSLNGGETVHLLGRPFGYFAGVSYNRSYSFYDDGVRRKYSYAPNADPEEEYDFQDAKGTIDVNWAGMVNLAYQPLDNHELGFTFLYNQNSEDVARIQTGRIQGFDDYTYRLHRLHFTERNLHTFQLKGSHNIPHWNGVKLDWLGALSFTSQDEPDVRFFNDIVQTDPNTGERSYLVSDTGNPTPTDPTRYFRDLDEKNRNVKIDLTVPFRQWQAEDGEFKFGLFDSFSTRTFIDREAVYKFESGDPGYNGDPNAYLTPDNLGWAGPPVTNMTTGAITYTWNRHAGIRESAYDADQTVRAGYAMVDTPVWKDLRVIGGVRYELTDMTVDSRSYQEHSLTGKTTNNATLNQSDLLPAAALVYALRPNMSLRLAWSQTIARPSFRELAAYSAYDPTTDDFAEGNPNITMTSVVNYDLRWEWFPHAGELLAVSLFYKDLTDAIERGYIRIDADKITWFNRPKAKVWGVEFELRKTLDFIDPLLSDFSIGGNFAFMQSKAELTAQELANKDDYIPGVEKSRPLYDQSPYIINLDFNYDNRYSGTSASLIYNVYGPRISIAQLVTEDVYEQPAPYLDFVISQRLTRRVKMRFSARNLLNPTFKRTYGKEGDFLYSSYTKGRTFGISLNYEF